MLSVKIRGDFRSAVKKVAVSVLRVTETIDVFFSMVQLFYSDQYFVYHKVRGEQFHHYVVNISPLRTKP